MNLSSKIQEWIRKYKYAIIILLVGVMLMLLPDFQAESEQTDIPVPAESESLQQMLEKILCQIDGAGKVVVLLTEQSGQEIRYQTDDESDQAAGSVRQRSDTVLVEGAGNQDTGLVRRVDPPVYRGAVIVCQGADSPQVRLAIVEAVRCVTGLGADQISVVKMK